MRKVLYTCGIFFILGLVMSIFVVHNKQTITHFLEYGLQPKEALKVSAVSEIRALNVSITDKKALQRQLIEMGYDVVPFQLITQRRQLFAIPKEVRFVLTDKPQVLNQIVENDLVVSSFATGYENERLDVIVQINLDPRITAQPDDLSRYVSELFWRGAYVIKNPDKNQTANPEVLQYTQTKPILFKVEGRKK